MFSKCFTTLRHLKKDKQKWECRKICAAWKYQTKLWPIWCPTLRHLSSSAAPQAWALPSWNQPAPKQQTLLDSELWVTIKDGNLNKQTQLLSELSLCIICSEIYNYFITKTRLKKKRYAHQTCKRSQVCLRLHCRGEDGEPGLSGILFQLLHVVELRTEEYQVKHQITN